MASKTVKFVITTTFSDKSGTATAKKVRNLAADALAYASDQLGADEKLTNPKVTPIK